MARSRLDGALWARIARRGGIDPSVAGEDAQYLTVDPTTGALVVTGAGAEPSATALYVADGSGSGRLANVDTSGAVLTRDVGSSGAGVSSANSLNTPLAADEEFIGPIESTVGFAEIRGTVITDVPSAADGLVVQFFATEDPSSWLKSESATIPGGGVGLHFAFQPEGSFFRIRYLNGPSGQGYIRSEVALNVRPGQQSLLPLGALVDDTNTATLTRASLLARHPSGAHLPLTTAGDGRLLVDTGQAQPLTAAELDNALVDVNTGLTQPLTDAQLAARGLATEQSQAAGNLTLGAIEGRLVTTNDRLADTNLHLADFGGAEDSSVRGWLRRVWTRLRYQRDEIAWAATAEGGYTAFNITTGIVTIAATGLQPLALLVNPANSGVDLWLYTGEFGASANTTFQRMRTASYTVTGNGLSPGNMGQGPTTSPARFYTPSNYTTTGAVTTKTAHIAAFQQYVTNINGRTRVRPGQAVEWRITGPGGLGGSMTASIYFEYVQRAAE